MVLIFQLKHYFLNEPYIINPNFYLISLFYHVAYCLKLLKISKNDVLLFFKAFIILTYFPISYIIRNYFNFS